MCVEARQWFGLGLPWQLYPLPGVLNICSKTRLERCVIYNPPTVKRFSFRIRLGSHPMRWGVRSLEAVAPDLLGQHSTICLPFVYFKPCVTTDQKRHVVFCSSFEDQRSFHTHTQPKALSISKIFTTYSWPSICIQLGPIICLNTAELFQCGIPLRC